ncbi:MAG: ABC transporter permease [Pirellula sp.]|jgi:phospholipid/cholesterol/gamma-HCH transport system permease protein|nr:ABC transporter permease [Pirellula sp.]
MIHSRRILGRQNRWRIGFPAKWLLLKFEKLGELLILRFLGIANILAVLWAATYLAIRPKSWTQPVRVTFVRQMVFTAVDGVPASLRFAAVFGVLIIVQAAIWIDMVGVTADIVSPILWQLVVRELSPLLACMVVIGRSGIAIGTELAAMKVSGEVEVLDSQGIDPMTYLVMPRILSIVVSIFCLAVIIAFTAVITGFCVASSMRVIQVGLFDFVRELSQNMSPLDAVFFASKTLIAGAFVGAICCLNGLSIRSAITDVPLVASRVGIQSLTSVFIISAILSLVFYHKLLVFKIGYPM